MKKIKILKEINNQKGVSAVLTLLITAVVLTISLSISALMVSEIRMVGAYDDSVIAYYAADAGIEEALLSVKNTGNIPNDNTSAPIFHIEKSTSHNQPVGSLSQDESVEVDIPSSPNQPQTITIKWTDTGKATEDSQAGTSICDVEWTLIAYDPTNISLGASPGCNIDKGFFDVGSGYSDSTGVKPGCSTTYFNHGEKDPSNNIIKIWPLSQYAYKLRFKCLYTHSFAWIPNPWSVSLSYSITGDDTAPVSSSGMITIGSTGKSNNVNRKVTVDINNPHKLMGIFDYVLYSEDALYKPSQ